MDRRLFLKAMTIGAAGVTGLSAAMLPTQVEAKSLQAEDLRSYLKKIKNFDAVHDDDLFLAPEEYYLLSTSVERFKRLQGTVGHANFYLLSFDEAMKIGKRYTAVGEFTKQELEFLEKIFYASASAYGFYGQKPLKKLTDRIPRRKVVKVPRTGNFLYRGPAERTYQEIKSLLGDQVVLTSGVRSVIKQFLLFLDKAYRSSGNLSLASRSLAPPGYSFHGVGDFDVGQVGFGEYNFTERFIDTDVFKKLNDLGYVRLRYPRNNMLGVRFEPWHVKVSGV